MEKNKTYFVNNLLKKIFPNDTDSQIIKKSSWWPLTVSILILIFIPFFGVMFFLLLAPAFLWTVIIAHYPVRKPKLGTYLIYTIWISYHSYCVAIDEYPLVMFLLEVNLALFFPDLLYG